MVRLAGIFYESKIVTSFSYTVGFPCCKRYNRNELAEAVAKLGLRPGRKLTRREWRAVRRRIPSRPRRFSKSFIASQLSERNKYRASVRTFQRNPDLTTQLDFEYDVPVPIQVGTTVTAYSRTYRILQRGTVLSYDERNARYLIQFEVRQFGHEFCPDSEVASHGPPQLLIAARERTLDGGTYLNMPRPRGTSFDVAGKVLKPILNVNCRICSLFHRIHRT